MTRTCRSPRRSWCSSRESRIARPASPSPSRTTRRSSVRPICHRQTKNVTKCHSGATKPSYSTQVLSAVLSCASVDKEEVQRKRQKTLPNFQDFSGLGGGGGGGGNLYRGGPGPGGGPGSAGGGKTYHAGLEPLSHVSLPGVKNEGLAMRSSVLTKVFVPAGYFQGLSAYSYGRGAGGGACPTGYATSLEGGGVKDGEKRARLLVARPPTGKLNGGLSWSRRASL